MGDQEIGWIAAIIIGGIAGWLAEQFMKSNMGLLMNIVLGRQTPSYTRSMCWRLTAGICATGSGRNGVTLWSSSYATLAPVFGCASISRTWTAQWSSARRA